MAEEMSKAQVTLSDGTVIDAQAGMGGVVQIIAGEMAVAGNSIEDIIKAMGEHGESKIVATEIKDTIEKTKKALNKAIQKAKNEIISAQEGVSTGLRGELASIVAKMEDYESVLTTASKDTDKTEVILTTLENVNKGLDSLTSRMAGVSSLITAMGVKIDGLDASQRALFDKFVSHAIAVSGSLGELKNVPHVLNDVWGAVSRIEGKAGHSSELTEDKLDRIIERSLKLYMSDFKTDLTVALNNNASSLDDIERELDKVEGKIKEGVKSGLEDFFRRSGIDATRLRDFGVNIDKLSETLTPRNVEKLISNVEKLMGVASGLENTDNRINALLSVLSEENIRKFDGVSAGVGLIVDRLTPEVLDSLVAIANNGGKSAESDSTKVLIDLLIEGLAPEQQKGIIAKIVDNVVATNTSVESIKDMVEPIFDGLDEDEKKGLLKQLAGKSHSKEELEQIVLDALEKYFGGRGEGGGGLPVPPGPVPVPPGPVPVPPGPVPEPVPEPEPEPGKKSKKYKKGKFLETAVRQTTILAEPKLPWYKRLARFTVHHPILTTLIGAGIGLATAGIGLGVFSATGLAGGILASAQSVAVGLAGGAGIGLVAGGAVSVVSSVIPAGRTARLCKKFMKQYKQCAKIDKKKDWYAEQTLKHDEKANEYRQKRRSGNRLLKSLGVYKLAVKYHRNAKKKSKAQRRLKIRQYVDTVDKALDTKTKINTKEIRKGKSYALAGFVEKKRKLASKLERGEIDEEEYAEILEDLSEEFADMKGGSEGLEDVAASPYDDGARQLYGDYEGEEMVGRVGENSRTEKMIAVMDDIAKRKTLTTKHIAEKVVEDFESRRKRAEKLRKEGKNAEAEAIENALAKDEAERRAYEEYMRARGEAVEEMTDATEDDIEEIMGRDND